MVPRHRPEIAFLVTVQRGLVPQPTIIRVLRVGTVNVNGGVWYCADAPFGGYKQSGIGREMGLLGFEEYLEAKLIATAAN